MPVKAIGVVLSLVFSATAIWWQQAGFLQSFSPDFDWPACHAFFPQCAQTITLSPAASLFILWTLGLGGLVSAILWAFGHTRFGSWLLTILLVIKMGLFLSRYNLMGNYHLMHFLLVAVFLSDHKNLFSYRFGLVSLYFLAGLLKLNAEWFSGAALVGPTVIPGEWLSLALAGVVALEIVGSWFLLSADATLRRTTLFLLFCFHAYSWHLVGPFYPLNMFLFLTPLVLAELAQQPRPVQKFSLRPGVALILFFLIWNLSQQITSRDPALEGRFRGLTINMLDARAVCHPLPLLRTETGDVLMNLPETTRSLRTRCDPAVFSSHLRHICARISAPDRLDWFLASRRTTTDRLITIEARKDLCASFR